MQSNNESSKKDDAIQHDQVKDECHSDGGHLGGGNFLVACAGLLRGMYREVFGSFVPGAITVCFFIALPMLTYYVLTPVEQLNQTASVLRAISNGGSSLGYVIATLFVTFSYAIGSILYRRPLEPADAVASFRQWAVMKEKRDGLTVQFKDPDGKCANCEYNRAGKDFKRYAELIASSSVKDWFRERLLELKMGLTIGKGRGEKILDYYGREIKYPYPNLRQYLTNRGFTELVKFVGWGDGKDGTKDHCSKNAINILKYRVRHYGSDDMVVEMDRNECHIRMLNSLWYSFRFIRFLVMVCSSLILISTVLMEVCRRADCDCVDVVLPTVHLTDDEGNAVVTNKFIVASTRFVVTVNVITNLPAESSIRLKHQKELEIGAASEGKEIVRKQLQDITACWSRNRGRFWAAFIMLSLFLGVTRCRRNIEMTFHYARQREIIFILESADILYNKNKDYFNGVSVSISGQASTNNGNS